jgi:hypothetical protein
LDRPYIQLSYELVESKPDSFGKKKYEGSKKCCVDFYKKICYNKMGGYAAVRYG